MSLRSCIHIIISLRSIKTPICVLDHRRVKYNHKQIINYCWFVNNIGKQIIKDFENISFSFPDSQKQLKMRSALISCSVLVVLVVIHSSAGVGETGGLTWGEGCNTSASIQDNPSTRCDTSRRLSCGMTSGKCKCHHEERDFYNEKTDRCETKVGKFCSGSDTFPTICVRNAVCDAASNFCVCPQGAEANSDGTECLKDDDEANSAVIGTPCHVAITLLAFIAGTFLF